MNKLRLERLKVKIDCVNSVFEDAKTQLVKKINNLYKIIIFYLYIKNQIEQI